VPEYTGYTAQCFKTKNWNFALCNNTERIMFTLGFDTSYNPLTQKEYFRFIPSALDWTFVVVALAQLRRQQHLDKIGENDEGEIKKEFDRASKGIEEKMPKLYKVYSIVRSVFFLFVIISSFIFCLIVLTQMERTLMNLISF